MARHSFSGAAAATSLSSGINSAVTAIPVNALTGTWPNTATGPFAVTIDRGTSSEEKILVSSYTSTQLTCTRGYDGTTAVSHSNGATVEHTIDAAQIDVHDATVAGVGTFTPTTSAVGDVAADGSQTTKPAAGDHTHGRESFYSSAPAAPTANGAAGSSASPSHGDHSHPFGSPDTGWTTINSFTNGWSQAIGTTVRWRIYNNVVYLVGDVQSNGSTGAQVGFVLPSSCEPAQVVRKAVHAFHSGADQVDLMSVDTSGNVVPNAGDDSLSNGDIVHINISYLLG